MKKSELPVATAPATAEPPGDADLIQRAQGGDGDAYGKLVVKYQDLVYNAVYRMVGREDEAADIAQEAFVKGWRALGSFEGRAQFGTWIYRIAINACISDRRGMKRRKATSLNSAMRGSDDEEGGLDVADGAPEPAEQLVDRENVRLVQEAIGDEIRVARQVDIHLHAVDDFQQVFLREVELFHHRNQRQRHRMLRTARVDFSDLPAPPVERGARHVGVGAFVHHIVHLAAKGIQRGDGAALVRWQEQEAVVEAGAAFCGFVLAILVGSHIRK